ncbi:unnamed protein product [Oikopleura dioica]|uniref:Uncharacterized protein n=1 Tax=Oikopleura dioica TaxID=34765 RepID=E4YF66_OIKDI|nr:unnamed protein product [Oikopleura dioica]
MSIVQNFNFKLLSDLSVYFSYSFKIEFSRSFLRKKVFKYYRMGVLFSFSSFAFLGDTNFSFTTRFFFRELDFWDCWSLSFT